MSDETNEMHEPTIPRHLVEANARLSPAMRDTKVASPQMTEYHVEQMDSLVRRYSWVKAVPEIATLVRALVSGEQVVVSRAELEAIKRELMLVSGEAYQSTGPNLVWEALRSPVNRVMRWLTPPSEGGQP
jgi:hypothetical protein